METANPISFATLSGNAKGRDYTKQAVKRGDPAFVMSRSELKVFAPCPARWINGYKGGDSKQLAWGDMLDCLVLTPEDFSDRFVVAPPTYPAPESAKKGAPIIQKPWNWNATYCKEWLEGQAEEPITRTDMVELEAARFALLKDNQIADLIAHSGRQVQITAEYKDDETGLTIPLKGLVDLAPMLAHVEFGKCLADLKTTNSAHPKPWAKQVNDYGYDMQAALYLDMWTAATGEDRCEFRHILQENYPPYQVGKRLLSSEFIDIGRQKYVQALKLYAQCLATNFWPDYEPKHHLNIQGWGVTEPMPHMLEV